MARFVPLTVALLLMAGTARAQDPEAAELFRQGKALAKEGEYARACPKFEASYERDAALGTLLNMADCHAHVGKIARAWGEFNLAVERAKKADDDRETFAREQADKLAPRLPRLTVTTTSEAPGLTVWRDEQRLVEGALGESLPVDPGAHAVTVRRDDDVLHTVEVTVAEKQREEVKLDLAAIDREHPKKEAPAGGVIVVEVEDPPAKKITTTTLIVTGGVGLVTAIGLEIAAASLRSSQTGSNCIEVESREPAVLCNPHGIDNFEIAGDLAEAGQWVGIGSIVLLATGVTLYFVPIWSPEPTSSQAGLRVGGAF